MSEVARRKALILALLLATTGIGGSIVFWALHAEPGSTGDAAIDEERLLPRIKEQVIQELREGDVLAQAIERGIERYFEKQKAAKEAARAEQARRANEKAKKVRRVSRARDHIRGNPDAVLSLIEYSDFECPYCKSFHPTAKQVVETYAGKVNWVYRHFPLSFHNPGAQKQAEAAECASELGGEQAFWTYTDAIYSRTTSNGQGFPLNKLVPLAKELGLDEHAFQDCLDSGRQTARVNEDVVEGKQIGVTGTPTSILLHNETGKVRIKSGAVPLTALKAELAQVLE